MGNITIKNALKKSMQATKQYIDENKFSGDYNDLENVPVLELRTTCVNKTAEEMDEIVEDEVYEAYSIVVPNLEIDSSVQYCMNITYKNGSVAIHKLTYDTVTTEDGIECVSLVGASGKILVVNSATVKDINNSPNKFISNDTNTCAITIVFIYSIASIELYHTEIIKRLNTELLPYEVIVKNSLAVGEGSVAKKNCTAFGEGTYAGDYGYGSHAEGYKTKVYGGSGGCHAEGYETEVDADYGAHAEGCKTKVTGLGAHAEGYYTIANGQYQHVQGRYNIEDTEHKYAHIVGNGADDYSTGNQEIRSNAHTLDWDGNAWYAGDIYVGGNNIDEGAVRVTTQKDLLELNKPKEYVLLKDIVTGNDYSIQMRNGQLISELICSDIEYTGDAVTIMEGMSFDSSDLTFNKIYSDGSIAAIENGQFAFEPATAIANTTEVTVSYSSFGLIFTTTIPIIVEPFDPETVLVDFEYTSNNDGTYTITDWKGTYNGESSTKVILPDNSLITL